MPSFRITPQAQSDLLHIRDYTVSRWGRRQARTYLRRLHDLIGLLAASPALGRARPEIADGLMSFPVEAHIIFYRRTPNGIEIRGVLHRARDVSDALADVRARLSTSGLDTG